MSDEITKRPGRGGKRKIRDGDVYDGWRVVELVGYNASGNNPRYLMECVECGNQKVIVGQAVKKQAACVVCNPPPKPICDSSIRQAFHRHGGPWGTLEAFVEELGSEKPKGKYLAAIRGGEISPGNAEWAEVPRGGKLYPLGEKLVAASEVAKHFGVSRQRVDQILQDNNDMPERVIAQLSLPPKERRKQSLKAFREGRIGKKHPNNRTLAGYRNGKPFFTCDGCGGTLKDRTKRCWKCKPHKRRVNEGWEVLSKEGKRFRVKCTTCGKESTKSTNGTKKCRNCYPRKCDRRWEILGKTGTDFRIKCRACGTPRRCSQYPNGKYPVCWKCKKDQSDAE